MQIEATQCCGVRELHGMSDPRMYSFQVCIQEAIADCEEAEATMSVAGKAKARIDWKEENTAEDQRDYPFEDFLSENWRDYTDYCEAPALIATTIPEQALGVKFLQDLGFKRVSEFRNPNTLNKVTFWFHPPKRWLEPPKEKKVAATKVAPASKKKLDAQWKKKVW